MAKKRPESVILDIFFSSLLLAFLLGSCTAIAHRSAAAMACWACHIRSHQLNKLLHGFAPIFGQTEKKNLIKLGGAYVQ